MSQQFQTVQNDALQLIPEEREKLAERLILSLAEAIDPDIEAAWFRAADERYKLYKEGKTEVFEVKDVIETLRKKNK
jgi:hypothetical protein